MFDIRDLSNTAIVLIIIMVLASVVTVRALTSVSPTEPTFVFQRVDQLDIDPNMAFTMLPNTVNVGVGDTFVVTIDVANVTNMFGWQVYLCYDPAVLECLGASLTPDYVFSSSWTVSSALVKWESTEFQPGPVQRVRNDLGWVLAGDCLMGVSQPTFNGSGVLCQIKFKTVSSGSCALALLHDFDHDFQTYILTPELTAVTASSASYTNVTVTSS
jgi:hypothetical protein